MAISDVSATHKDAVSTFLKGLEDLVRTYSGRAQCSNGSEVWWILKTAHPCQIGAGISAPITQETNDCRFKLFTGHSCSPEGGIANEKLGYSTAHRNRPKTSGSQRLLYLRIKLLV